MAIRSVSSNTGTTLSVSIGKPTGTVSNDILIVWLSAKGGTGVTVTPTDSWTAIGTTLGGATMRDYCAWRRAGGSEPANYAFTLGSNVKWSGGIVCISGAITTGSPINANSQNDNGTIASGTLTATTISPTATSELIGLWATEYTTVNNITGYDAPFATEEWEVGTTGSSSGSNTTTSATTCASSIAAGATGNNVATTTNSARFFARLIAVELAATNPTLSGAATASAATGSGTGIAVTSTLSGAALAAAATGSGTGIQSASTVSGAATAGAATGSGAGVQTLIPSALSGAATADPATGSGTGIQSVSSLSGSATADPATGTGAGLASISTLLGTGEAGAATGDGAGIAITSTLSGAADSGAATGSGTGITVSGGGGAVSYATTILNETGLVAYWRLGESAGTTAVDAFGSHDGTIDGATLGVTGALNGDANTAMSFDGSNDRIKTAAVVLTATDNYTLEAWVKPASLSQSGFIVMNGGSDTGYGFGISNNGAASDTLTGLFGGVAWATSGYSFPNTTGWYHVVMVRDSGTTKFYVNGTQTPTTHGFTPSTPTTHTSIGNRHPGFEADHFNGLIDEVAIYNVVLTPTQIQDHYDIGLTGGDDTRTLSGTASVGAATSSGAGITVAHRRVLGTLVAPNPLISQGVPAYASTETSGEEATKANDSDYVTGWRSTAVPAWLAYDLSGVSGLGQVIVAWYNDHYTQLWQYDLVGGQVASNMPQDYTIEANAGAGGGAPPGGGWVTLATVTGNIYNSRQHVVDLTGYNWVRLNVSAIDGTTGQVDVAVNMDVHAAPLGAKDSIIIFGDSLTNGTHNHSAVRPSGEFAEQVQAARPAFYPVVQGGGVNGATAQTAADEIAGWLAVFPGQYIGLAYGTNEANSPTVDADVYRANLMAVIDAILAAGKVPVLAKIPYSTDSEVGTNAPALNAVIDDLYDLYGGWLLEGPDLWTWLQANSGYLGGDGIHLDSSGYDAMRVEWVNTFLERVYTAGYAGAAIGSGAGITTDNTVTLSGSATADVATGSGAGIQSVSTASGAASADAATGTGAGLQSISTVSGSAQADPATGTGAGIQSVSTLSGSATADAATSSGAGITVTSTLSGAATPDPATGSGAGIANLGVFTLSGSAQASPATGDGAGINTTGNQSLSGQGFAAPATGTGAGLQSISALSGAASAGAASGSGTGLASISGLSGGATAGAATGSGTGLQNLGIYTLSGAALAAAATGSGGGVAVWSTLSGAASAQPATGSGIGVGVTSTLSGAATASAAFGTGMGVRTIEVPLGRASATIARIAGATGVVTRLNGTSAVVTRMTTEGSIERV
jgi:lysophospholipase L1-like esterase